MAFHIYPDSPNPPLSVLAGIKSPAQAFAEPAGLAANAKMFIRVAMSAQQCPTSNGTAPTVSLKAGNGVEKDVLLNGVVESYFNSTTENATTFEHLQRCFLTLIKCLG